MRRTLLLAIMGSLLALGAGGCGDSLNIQSQKISPVQYSLRKSISELLYGLTKLEKFAAQGDYTDAKTLTHNLDDEFHQAILPPLTVKKGKMYADGIHKKYDELEDAVAKKDKDKIAELINVNRENLKTVAKILGVPVISSK